MLRSLAARTALVTCVVAVVSVMVTAAVGAPLVLTRDNKAAQQRLEDDATLLVEVLRPRLATARNAADEEAVVKRLSKTMDVYLIRGGVPDRAGLPPAVVKAIAGGTNVKVRRYLVDGRVRLLVGRAVGKEKDGSAGNGFVVTEPPPSGTFLRFFGQLWVALLAGLAAGLIAGPLLARRISRPIRRVAAAAKRLGDGDRSVRLSPEGPAEVKDLAHAVNRLTAALATSEGRERDFLLSVSHELRTPLTTIRGYAEALADGVVGPDGAQRAGQTVLDEAERLDRLIADLLVLARLEAADLPIEVVEVDLTQLVATTAEAWGARIAAAGLILRTELPGHPVQVRTDPGRIRQIVDGLLENALRVVPAPAPVVLALHTTPPSTPPSTPTGAWPPAPDRPTLTWPGPSSATPGANGGPAPTWSPAAGLGPAWAAPSGSAVSGPSVSGPSVSGAADWGSAASDAGASGGGGATLAFARLEVRDGGPGFTDEDLAVAFERGALSRRYQGVRKVGTGLGLALAARLARRLGAGIDAGHAPEGGAQFTVTFPLPSVP